MLIVFLWCSRACFLPQWFLFSSEQNYANCIKKNIRHSAFRIWSKHCHPVPPPPNKSTVYVRLYLLNGRRGSDDNLWPEHWLSQYYHISVDIKILNKIMLLWCHGCYDVTISSYWMIWMVTWSSSLLRWFSSLWCLPTKHFHMPRNFSDESKLPIARRPACSNVASSFGVLLITALQCFQITSFLNCRACWNCKSNKFTQTPQRHHTRSQQCCWTWCSFLSSTAWPGQCNAENKTTPSSYLVSGGF